MKVIYSNGHQCHVESTLIKYVADKTTYENSNNKYRYHHADITWALYTGIIQLRLVQKVYHEEIQFYKRTSLARPNEILEDIRTLVFPNKRVALQQALAQADAQGDGYLQMPAFVGAFQRANVGMDRDTLEFLFDIMSESYTMPKTDYEPKSAEDEEQAVERVVPLDFFMSKLFQQQETREIDEVEQTLANIKAALIYKGLDFSVVFAEQSEDVTKKPKR